METKCDRLIRSYVAAFEIVIFLHLIKSETEIQNGVSYSAFEEQWESNSALRVETPALRKWPPNV